MKKIFNIIILFSLLGLFFLGNFKVSAEVGVLDDQFIEYFDEIFSYDLSNGYFYKFVKEVYVDEYDEIVEIHLDVEVNFKTEVIVLQTNYFSTCVELEEMTNDLDATIIYGQLVLIDDRIDDIYFEEENIYYSDVKDDLLISEYSFFSRILSNVFLGATVLEIVSEVTGNVIGAALAITIETLCLNEIEQEKKCESTQITNYQYNSTLLGDGRCLNVNVDVNNTNKPWLYGYITDQKYVNKSWQYYSMDEFLIGSSANLSAVGCEIIACYNVLKYIGQNDDIAQTIYDIETKDILYFANGKYGSKPEEIYRYLDEKNCNYSNTCIKNSFIRHINNNDNFVSIVSFYNKDFFNNGIHTFMLMKKDNQIYTFNDKSQNNYEKYSNINNLLNRYGGFKYAYFF